MARIEFFTLMVSANYEVQTVCFEWFPSAFDNSADTSLSLQKIQQVMDTDLLDTDLVANLIFSLLPHKPSYRLAMYRTDWKFEQQNINVLIVAVFYHGDTFSLLFKMLQKLGDSNINEDIKLKKRFIRLSGLASLNCLIADYEFVSRHWIRYINSNRVRRDTRICEKFWKLQLRNGKKVKSSWLFSNLPLVLISGKFDSLIADNSVSTLYKVFSVNDLILKPTFLTDDKVRVDDIDFIQSDEIKVAPIEDVGYIGFVRDVIHRLSIVNVGIGDIDVRWNLRNDIKKRVSLDLAFCVAELCPPEKADKEINCRGVKNIKIHVKAKWCINPFILRNLDEFSGKLLKYAVIAVRVCLGKVRQLYLIFAKPKMVGSSGMSGYHADEFSESFAAVQLSEHHNKQLSPAGKAFDILVSIILFDYPIKGFLWQKPDQLCKYIRYGVHIALWLGLGQYINQI